MLPLLLLSLFVGVAPSRAILFASTSDPTFNTSAPGGTLQDSGWQFQGRWNTKLATPIAPWCFVTAAHVGGTVGDPFVFAGQSFVTSRVDISPTSDLAVWQVTTALPAWAQVYPKSDEVGKSLVVFGLGTQRGGGVTVLGRPLGWYWGPGDGAQRWGTNVVSTITAGPPDQGSLLTAEFNLNASPTEAHLSVGDSGGGVFIKDSDKVWKLAGINVDVDGYYATNASGTLLNSIWPGLASLFDQSGLYKDGYTGVFTPATGPGRWYATRISSNLAFIDSKCPYAGVAQCANGIDDDNDSKIDLTDPDCTGPTDSQERAGTSGSCGLGAELLFAMPLLLALGRRTRPRADQVSWRPRTIRIFPERTNSRMP
jgi:hypothetical protein